MSDIIACDSMKFRNYCVGIVCSKNHHDDPFDLICIKLGFRGWRDYCNSTPNIRWNSNYMRAFQNGNSILKNYPEDVGKDESCMAERTRMNIGGGDVDGCIKTIYNIYKNEPTIVYPTTEEFLSCSRFDSVSKKKLWFCSDWNEDDYK